MSVDYERKYGTAASITIMLYDADGADPSAVSSFESGDIKLSKDGGTWYNLDVNTQISATGNGQFVIALSASDLQCKGLRILAKDQTDPEAFQTWDWLVETTGNAGAQHAFDRDSATVQNVATVATVGTVTNPVTAAPVTLAAGTHTGATIPNVTSVGSVQTLSAEAIKGYFRDVRREVLAEPTSFPAAGEWTPELIERFLAVFMGGGKKTFNKANGVLSLYNGSGNVVCSTTVNQSGNLTTMERFAS